MHPCLLQFPLPYSKLVPILWNPTQFFFSPAKTFWTSLRQLLPHLVSPSYTSFVPLNVVIIYSCVFFLHETRGQRTVLYSCWQPQCLVHCSACITVVQAINLYWTSGFCVLCTYYVPGTVREASYTTSYCVSQQPYEWGEWISEIK